MADHGVFGTSRERVYDIASAGVVYDIGMRDGVVHLTSNPGVGSGPDTMGCVRVGSDKFGAVLPMEVEAIEPPADQQMILSHADCADKKDL